MPSAKYNILPAGSDYAGKSIADWSAEWWQWAAHLPDTNEGYPPTHLNENAFDDTTGALAYQGEVGGPVFFVAGTISSDQFPVAGEAHRSFIVPQGEALLVPLLNTEFCYPGQDPSNVENDLAGAIARASEIHLKIDGKTIVSANSEIDGELNRDGYHYEQSDLFSFGKFDGNKDTVGYTQTFYTDQHGKQPHPGEELYPSEAGGWWAMITDLKPGPHHLEFGGTFEYGEVDFSTKVVDDIFVLPAHSYADTVLA